MSNPAHSQAKAASRDASDSPIGVVLVITSGLERLGWSIVIDHQADMQILGQFSTCREALAWLADHAGQVVLVDEAMLTPADCEVLRLHAARTGTRFLLVARHPIDSALETTPFSFASQCLLKGVSSADLLAAIRRCGTGRHPPQRQT